MNEDQHLKVHLPAVVFINDHIGPFWICAVALIYLILKLSGNSHLNQHSMWFSCWDNSFCHITQVLYALSFVHGKGIASSTLHTHLLRESCRSLYLFLIFVFRMRSGPECNWAGLGNTFCSKHLWIVSGWWHRDDWAVWTGTAGAVWGSALALSCHTGFDEPLACWVSAPVWWMNRGLALLHGS